MCAFSQVIDGEEEFFLVTKKKEVLWLSNTKNFDILKTTQIQYTYTLTPDAEKNNDWEMQARLELEMPIPGGEAVPCTPGAQSAAASVDGQSDDDWQSVPGGDVEPSTPPLVPIPE